MTGGAASSDGLPGIGGHRYEGYSLETKYGWLQQGQGAAAVTEGADFLAELAGAFAESERTIRTALGRLGVSWHGTAAEQAATALGAVADWARGSAVSSAGGSATIGEYGESFARLRSRVAEPPARTQGSRPASVLDGLFDAVSPDFGAVTGLQTDYRRRLAEYQRLDRAANDALYAHEAQSRAAVRAFPIPQAPPSVAPITTAISTATLTGRGPIQHHPGAVPPGVPGKGVPDQGGDPTVDVSAPTQPAAAQSQGAQSQGAQPLSTQSPGTVPAAGGVARAGGAVPDPGLLGGHGAPPGVDPGGVLPGAFPGFAGDPGARQPERWSRPATPGASGRGEPGVGEQGDWSRQRPGGYSGGYGGDYGGGLRPRGVPGFAGPGGELPGGPAGGGSAGGGVPGPARPSQLGVGQLGVGQPGAGQGGVGQGGVDFDLPDGGRGSEVGRGRGQGRTRPGSGFLPSDEPFAVDCDDVPAVLGLPEGDEQRW
jgi:hypothetical protein